MKKVITLVLTLVIILNPGLALAVKSNSVITRVGEPSGPPPGQSTSSIVDAAASIVAKLQRGTNGWYNYKIDEPNLPYPGYWCQFLVVDSYNAAGYSGLNRNQHFTYSQVRGFFENTSGFRFVDAKTPVESLKAGDVVFFLSGAGYHVAIISSINVDENGYGAINTYDSNSIEVTDHIWVKNHLPNGVSQNLGNYKPLNGFGQIQ